MQFVSSKDHLNSKDHNKLDRQKTLIFTNFNPDSDISWSWFLRSCIRNNLSRTPKYKRTEKESFLVNASELIMTTL